VITTMEGKSAFPEVHPLSLGSGSMVMSDPARHFVADADLVLAIGTSMTRHGMVMTIPPGKTVIHATNAPVDIGKSYDPDIAILGDARLVLRQFIDAAKDLTSGTAVAPEDGPATEIKDLRDDWLAEWMPKLSSAAEPINPYRIIWEFMQNVDPAEAIVTHDAGGPRFELMPFYVSNGPHTYIGWGKSHQLGTGLAFAIGAKLAAPDKLCVNFMGDASFGMTGLDFETAVRNDLPILTIMINNGGMTGIDRSNAKAHELYGTANLGGDYATMAKAMGGWAERVEDPEDVGPAIQRAKRATQEGQAALLEFMASQETGRSNLRPFD
jgi:acetolactate synthase-1/2/3 large subunit